MRTRFLAGMLSALSAMALTGTGETQTIITLETTSEDVGAPAELQSQTGGGGEIRLLIQPQVLGGDTASAFTFERITEMRDTVLLGLRTDPRLVPPERVMELVQSIGMVDDFGVRITSGFDINLEHQLVVASSAGSVEITHIHEDERGLVIAALVRGRDGQVIDPPEGSLAVYRIGGERLCFDEEIINQPVRSSARVPAQAGPARLPMSFVLLLDRSGSMAGYMHEVRRAAQSFLDTLPDNASCSVGAFAEGDASFAARDGFGIGLSCRADVFSLDGLRDAGGGTNFYRPLGTAYDLLSEDAHADDQRLVIIITDGEANRELEREAAVRASKGDIRTFVYHIGGQEERFLSSIADHYLSHQGDLAASLERYFEVLSESYTSQTILRLGQCNAPQPMQED